MAGLNDGLPQLIEMLSGTTPEPRILPPDGWKLIIERSGRYGVSGIAAFAARPISSGETRRWCDQVLTRQWQRFSHTLVSLQDVLRILRDAKTDIIVLKGPLLALRHYQPPFLRKPSLDIDLAIREKDIESACAALKSMGYLPAKTLAEAKAFAYDLTLYHDSKPRIELHFRLSHGATGISVEQFFGRSRIMALPDGTSANVLSEADEILHLVLHYAHHRFPLLFNLYEIRLIWTRASTAVKHEAIQRAIEHRFFGAFLMTDIAFKVIWKEDFLPKEQSRPRTWLQWRVNERLFWQCVAWSASGANLTLANRLRGRWLDFQITDGPWDALRFFSMVAKVAWFRLRRRGWRTLKYQHHTTGE
jgi:hypothetical protein